jgi:hypothetical protein
MLALALLHAVTSCAHELKASTVTTAATMEVGDLELVCTARLWHRKQPDQRISGSAGEGAPTEVPRGQTNNGPRKQRGTSTPHKTFRPGRSSFDGIKALARQSLDSSSPRGRAHILISCRRILLRLSQYFRGTSTICAAKPELRPRFKGLASKPGCWALDVLLKQNILDLNLKTHPLRNGERLF